jgi:glycosyltransferase involved in cell wall biosynthesis
MKILFISQYFWPEDFKGNDVAFDLVKRGHEVTVLTAKPNYPKGSFYPGYNFFGKSTEIIQGVTVIRTPVFPRRSGRAIPLALNYLSFVLFSFWAFLFRLKNNYDVILVQQLSPIFSALPGVWMNKKYGIPMVLWVLDLWPESIEAAGNIRYPLLLNWVGGIVKKVYKHSNHILISSRSFKNSIITKVNHYLPVTYFPNWAEDVFTSVEIKTNKSGTIFPDGFNILFAGNIGEAQDFKALILAAKLTQGKGINWIIVGDGRKLPWLKTEVEDKKLNNVYFKGRYPIEKMPDFFHAADAMLISLKNEPLFALTVPAKLQAYLASGKIILGMLNGEGAEIIKQAKCGYVVNAGDSAGLAQQAIKLNLLSPEDRKMLEKNSREFYRLNFNKTKLLDELETILLSICNSNR